MGVLINHLGEATTRFHFNGPRCCSTLRERKAAFPQAPEYREFQQCRLAAEVVQTVPPSLLLVVVAAVVVALPRPRVWQHRKGHRETCLRSTISVRGNGFRAAGASTCRATGKWCRPPSPGPVGVVSKRDIIGILTSTRTRGFFRDHLLWWWWHFIQIKRKKKNSILLGRLVV